MESEYLWYPKIISNIYTAYTSQEYHGKKYIIIFNDFNINMFLGQDIYIYISLQFSSFPSLRAKCETLWQSTLFNPFFPVYPFFILFLMKSFWFLLGMLPFAKAWSELKNPTVTTTIPLRSSWKARSELKKPRKKRTTTIPLRSSLKARELQKKTNAYSTISFVCSFLTARLFHPSGQSCEWSAGPASKYCDWIGWRSPSGGLFQTFWRTLSMPIGGGCRCTWGLTH